MYAVSWKAKTGKELMEIIGKLGLEIGLEVAMLIATNGTGNALSMIRRLMLTKGLMKGGSSAK